MRARVARHNAGKHYSAVENVQGKARSAPIFRSAQHNANAGAMVPACHKNKTSLGRQGFGEIFLPPHGTNIALLNEIKSLSSKGSPIFSQGKERTCAMNVVLCGNFPTGENKVMTNQNPGQGGQQGGQGGQHQGGQQGGQGGQQGGGGQQKPGQQQQEPGKGGQQGGQGGQQDRR
jgi:hypothetical protein